MSSTIQRINLSPHIVLLEIDNPPANSLSKKIKERFVSLLDNLEADSDIRTLIITGRGGKFCVGDDLKEAIANIQDLRKVKQNLQQFGQIMDRIEALPFPTIAAINGWCIGGGLELALCCDIRVAVPSAQFICAGVNIGLTASGYRLPRIIGIARAKQMLYTGLPIDASKALSYGLITEIYEGTKLMQAAKNMAITIAQKAPLSLQATKRIVNCAFETNAKQAQSLQEKELLQLAHTEDYKNALSAFAVKQKPIFNGK
ncbi:MAG: enoyl-CoA hydratase/isomerase family protein [Bacteroidota bacterium]